MSLIWYPIDGITTSRRTFARLRITLLSIPIGLAYKEYAKNSCFGNYSVNSSTVLLFWNCFM